MEIEGVFFNTNDYELDSNPLYQGPNCTSYSARNTKSKQKCIAKIINTYDNFNGSEQMKLIQESVKAHKFDHPLLAKFYGINFQSFTNSHELQPTIISEFIENGSLSDVLNHKKELTETKKFICLIGIAEAMRYLHEQNSVHLNLKPENILFDNNDYPIICDYCFSNCLSLKKTQESIKHMAPELIKNTNFDKSVDVYSFGILAFEIINGMKVFSELSSSTTQEDLEKIITDGFSPNFSAKFSSNMQNLILSCLNINPEERPTFDEIYSRLSKDYSYIKDHLDEEEIDNFINKISSCPNEKEIEKFNQNQMCKKFDVERKMYVNLIKSLARNTRFINEINIDNMDAFQYACQIGNYEIVKYLYPLKKWNLKKSMPSIQ